MAELRAELKKRGLAIDGVKAVLQARLDQEAATPAAQPKTKEGEKRARPVHEAAAEVVVVITQF